MNRIRTLFDRGYEEVTHKDVIAFVNKDESTKLVKKMF